MTASPARTVRVGVAQLSPVPYDAEAARAATVAAARDLFERDVDVVVVPELAVPGYGLDAERLGAAAEPIDGPTVTAWQTLADEHKGLVVGGFCERGKDAALFNAVAAVSGEGPLLHYRKLHLFGSEKLVFAPGDRGLPVTATRWGVLGMCVCYDLRFVETLRVLALRGAELVCAPTAWIRGFDALASADGGLIAQAQGVAVQANLDQVFVAAASQAGKPGDHDLLGSSLVVDPFGKTVVGPLSRHQPASAWADLDLADVERAAHRSELITPREDRRRDLYGLVIDGATL